MSWFQVFGTRVVEVRPPGSRRWVHPHRRLVEAPCFDGDDLLGAGVPRVFGSDRSGVYEQRFGSRMRLGADDPEVGVAAEDAGSPPRHDRRFGPAGRLQRSEGRFENVDGAVGDRIGGGEGDPFEGDDEFDGEVVVLNPRSSNQHIVDSGELFEEGFDDDRVVLIPVDSDRRVRPVGQGVGAGRGERIAVRVESGDDRQLVDDGRRRRRFEVAVGELVGTAPDPVRESGNEIVRPVPIPRFDPGETPNGFESVTGEFDTRVVLPAGREARAGQPFVEPAGVVDDLDRGPHRLFRCVCHNLEDLVEAGVVAGELHRTFAHSRIGDGDRGVEDGQVGDPFRIVDRHCWLGGRGRTKPGGCSRP
jgi:hypothetical protein